VQAVIVGATADPERSNEVAFEAAANDAVLKALKNNIVLLEPIMKLVVTVRTSSLATCFPIFPAGALPSSEPNRTAAIPRSRRTCRSPRCFDYADKVRSLSQGRAGSSMEPFRYAPAPDDLLKSFTDPDY